MTNTEIKIKLEKILLRNEQRKVNKLIPSDILDIKDIIKQLTIPVVVGQSEQLVCYLYDDLGCAISGENNENCKTCKYAMKAN